MTWLYYALISSMLWGMSYAVGERLLRVISIPTLMLFSAIGNILFATFYVIYKNNIKTDIATLDQKYTFMLFFCTAANIIATLLVNIATQQKNATMAGLIEISYPFFAAITAFVLFGDKQLNINSFIGALFIVFGTLIISKF